MWHKAADRTQYSHVTSETGLFTITPHRGEEVILKSSTKYILLLVIVVRFPCNFNIKNNTTWETDSILLIDLYMTMFLIHFQPYCPVVSNLYDSLCLGPCLYDMIRCQKMLPEMRGICRQYIVNGWIIFQSDRKIPRFDSQLSSCSSLLNSASKHSTYVGCSACQSLCVKITRVCRHV